MNDPHARRRRRGLIVVSALLATLATACAKPAAPPLEGAAIGGPFSLVDQDGHAVTDQAYAGRYRLIYFGYTFCPDVCPTTLQTLMKGVALLRQAKPQAAAKLVPIFISIDPARDTPPVMKAYVTAFGPGLIGLTGTPAEIAAVARRYAVSYQKVVTPGASGYLMNHSSQPILFGPKGAPIALVHAIDGPATVERELATWVK